MRTELEITACIKAMASVVEDGNGGSYSRAWYDALVWVMNERGQSKR